MMQSSCRPQVPSLAVNFRIVVLERPTRCGGHIPPQATFWVLSTVQCVRVCVCPSIAGYVLYSPARFAIPPAYKASVPCASPWA